MRRSLMLLFGNHQKYGCNRITTSNHQLRCNSLITDNSAPHPVQTRAGERVGNHIQYRSLSVLVSKQSVLTCNTYEYQQPLASKYMIQWPLSCLPLRLYSAKRSKGPTARVGRVLQQPLTSFHKIAVHDINDSYLISLDPSDVENFIEKEHPDKKLLMTNIDNEEGERIVKLTWKKKKDTIFIISTGIAKADLQVKVAAITRKAHSGLTVYVKFKHTRANAEISASSCLDSLKPLLEKESLIVTINRGTPAEPLQIMVTANTPPCSSQ